MDDFNSKLHTAEELLNGKLSQERTHEDEAKTYKRMEKIEKSR